MRSLHRLGLDVEPVRAVGRPTHDRTVAGNDGAELVHTIRGFADLLQHLLSAGVANIIFAHHALPEVAASLFEVGGRCQQDNAGLLRINQG